MKKCLQIFALIFISAFVFPEFIPSGYCEIYKWVDENGISHYSDRPYSKEAEQLNQAEKSKKNNKAGNSEKNNFGPLLFKIEKDNLAPSHLFGTIHTEDERVLNLPSLVLDVFNSSSSFTMEIDMNIVNLLKMSSQLILPQGESLEGLLGADFFNQTALAMETLSISREVANRMKPWAVAMTLSMPKPKTGMFLDLLLYTRAIKKGIPVYGLESPEEQLDIFDTMSLDDQKFFLKATLDSLSKKKQVLDQFHALYLAGNMDELYTMSMATMELKNNTRLEKYIIKRLLTDRNILMTKRMQPRLKKGNAFIAVGTLHLPGRQGIISLLKKMGYKVERAR